MFRKFLASLRLPGKKKGMPDNPFADPSDTELEMITDSMHIAEHGRPIKRPAAQGIAEMQARLVLLDDDEQKIRRQVAMNPKYKTDVSFKAGIDHIIAEIEQERRETQSRLAEYKAQKEGLN